MPFVLSALDKIPCSGVKTISTPDGKYFTNFGKKQNMIYAKHKFLYKGETTYNCRPINDVDLETFQVLDFSTAKDKNKVYVFHSDHEKFFITNPSTIEDPLTFQPLQHEKEIGTSSDYSKDSKNVYYKFIPMNNADVDTFVLVDSQYHYAKDKNHTYMRGEIVDR